MIQSGVAIVTVQPVTVLHLDCVFSDGFVGTDACCSKVFKSIKKYVERLSADSDA